MGRADPERPGPPAAATAGTLDTGAPDSGAPGPGRPGLGTGATDVTGQAPGRAEDDPAGQAAADASSPPAAASPPRPGSTGPGRVRRAFRKPVVQHLGILLGF